jgi:hypothetical protein
MNNKTVTMGGAEGWDSHMMGIFWGFFGFFVVPEARTRALN